MNNYNARIWVLVLFTFALFCTFLIAEAEQHHQQNVHLTNLQVEYQATVTILQFLNNYDCNKGIGIPEVNNTYTLGACYSPGFKYSYDGDMLQLCIFEDKLCDRRVLCTLQPTNTCMLNEYTNISISNIVHLPPAPPAGEISFYYFTDALCSESSQVVETKILGKCYNDTPPNSFGLSYNYINEFTFSFCSCSPNTTYMCFEYNRYSCNGNMLKGKYFVPDFTPPSGTSPPLLAIPVLITKHQHSKSGCLANSLSQTSTFQTKTCALCKNDDGKFCKYYVNEDQLVKITYTDKECTSYVSTTDYAKGKCYEDAVYNW